MSKDKTSLKAEFETHEEIEKSQRVLQVSEMDAYIADRLRAQPEDITSIERIDQHDPTKHRLSLPKELEKDEYKKFAFKWIGKNKQSLDYHLDARGWRIVTRSYFPELPEHLFTVNGAIERGDLLLGVISLKKAEEIRKAPGERSKQIIEGQYQKHSDDPRFYTPDVGTNESEDVQRI